MSPTFFSMVHFVSVQKLENYLTKSLKLLRKKTLLFFCELTPTNSFGELTLIYPSTRHGCIQKLTEKKVITFLRKRAEVK